MYEVSERFTVRGEDGTLYDAVTVRDRKPDPTLDDPNGTVLGLAEHKLADGRRLTPLSDDSFRIVATGAVVTRI